MKREWHMNLKTVTAKHLKMEFKKPLKCGTSFHWGFNQRYEIGFVEKTRDTKLKIQENHMTLTSILMFSPEFSLKKELCNTSVSLSSHPWIKTKFDYF